MKYLKSVLTFVSWLFANLSDWDAAREDILPPPDMEVDDDPAETARPTKHSRLVVADMSAVNLPVNQWWNPEWARIQPSGKIGPPPQGTPPGTYYHAVLVRHGNRDMEILCIVLIIVRADGTWEIPGAFASDEDLVAKTGIPIRWDKKGYARNLPADD